MDLLLERPLTQEKQRLKKVEEKGIKERSSLKILLAEDNIVNQKLAVALLQKRGHVVLVVSDRLRAVAAYSEHDDLDLILMDVQMPEMDGLEATMAIRELEKKSGRHIPIVAMTAYAMKGDRTNFLEKGMDNYLTKPVRADILYDVVESLGRNAQDTAVNEDEGRKSACGYCQDIYEKYT